VLPSSSYDTLFTISNGLLLLLLIFVAGLLCLSIFAISLSFSVLTELNDLLFLKIKATETVIAMTTAATQPITMPIIAPVLRVSGSLGAT
jgi:hypothetical protein